MNCTADSVPFLKIIINCTNSLTVLVLKPKTVGINQVYQIVQSAEKHQSNNVCNMYPISTSGT